MNSVKSGCLLPPVPLLQFNRIYKTAAQTGEENYICLPFLKLPTFQHNYGTPSMMVRNLDLAFHICPSNFRQPSSWLGYSL